METLSRMKCVACRKDAPTVTDAEVAEFHRQVSVWEIVELDGIKRLRRAFLVDDFAQALEFTEKSRRTCRGRGASPGAADRMGRSSLRTLPAEDFGPVENYSELASG
jgi:4a-hydroxytetrahydrobiopterin dehydratase